MVVLELEAEVGELRVCRLDYIASWRLTWLHRDHLKKQKQTVFKKSMTSI
jgi:hypothetical protein